MPRVEGEGKGAGKSAGKASKPAAKSGGMVNRTAVGTYKGKLHQRQAGAYGSGGNEAGTRRGPPGREKTQAGPESAGGAEAGAVSGEVPAVGANGEPTGQLDRIECDGQVVDIATLVPDPNNARVHNDRNLDAIKHSLAKYGQRKPIVVRQQDLMVAAGNGTLEAAKALGWTKLAASVRPMTDEEFTGYGLADNRTAELAKWNFEVVARLDKLMSEQGESTMIGWSPDELEVLRAADWTPPPVDEGAQFSGNGDGSASEPLMVSFTPDQYEIVGAAIAAVREGRASPNGEPVEADQAEALVAICRDWFGEDEEVTEDA